MIVVIGSGLCATGFWVDEVGGDYTETAVGGYSETYERHEYYYDYYEEYLATRGKGGKKPIVAKDPPYPVRKWISSQWYRPAAMIRRMMFDRSGKLPKRIRRIRKSRN